MYTNSNNIIDKVDNVVTLHIYTATAWLGF